MKQLKYLVAAALCLISSAYAANYKLDENKVIDLAIKRNETIGIAKEELDQAQEALSSANSNYFPTLSITAGIRKSDGEGNFVPYGYDWNHNGTIQLTQPIYTFGKISNGKSIAESAKRISELNTTSTNAQVINVAKQLYYRVLFNEEIVKITYDSYKNALKNKKALEDRVSYGRISRNDNIKMQADLASRKPNWIIAKKNLKNAVLDLKNYLALDYEDEVEVLSTPLRPKKKISTTNDLNKLEETVDIKILKENIRLADFSVELAKSQRLPDLGVYVSYSPTLAKTDLFAGETTHDQKDLTFGVQFSFDWDLGGSKNSEVAIKRSDYNIATLKLKQIKREIRTQYLKLKQDYEGLQERYDAEDEAVELASSSYKVALSSFRSGGVSQLQLNDSEIQLTQNRLSLAQTKLQIQITRAEMDRLLTKTSSRNKGGR
ncbi:TolC family protein [Halobacteriovorax sp. DPLXC-1]|uniref:TolC family protein n=1 Tax=Halobacteriovorax sp. DPLXC-1 TaxID=3110771 RepID=UPI002FF10485